MTSTLLKADVFTSQSQELFKWIAGFTERFPKWVDSRLLKGLYYLSGPGISPSFMKERSLFHLKRLLLTQFLIQKKIENELALGKELFLVKIFSIDSLICVAVACPKRQTCLAGETILEIASQKVPALRQVETSFYSWQAQALPYTFCYVELEKMRGKDLLTSEIKKLESHLQQEIDYYLSEAPIFWPYNHEEAFKQLLILAKEISSEEDDPQVSIHFQKQTSNDLEFMIYIARPKSNLSEETTITDRSFSPSTQLITHLRKEIGSEVPTMIEAFSLLIPIAKHKQRSTADLLHAREFVSNLFESAIGTFRDYNGGLFEMQRERFKELARVFSEKIPQFCLFAKKLFYALVPIEMQMSLDDSGFERLFTGFSKVLSQSTSFFNEPNSHIVIFKSQDADALTAYLDQTKHFQEKKKIVAYARINILSESYLCLIYPTVKALQKLRRGHLATHSSDKEILRLSFQEGAITSLCPAYLYKEFRGRTLSKLLFEGLAHLSPKNRIIYSGCKDIEISKNELCYLFHLRSNHWSDGMEVSAFHYEQGWKKSFLKDFSLFHALKNAENIKQGKLSINSLGVSALNHKLLQVDLEYKDPSFLYKLTTSIFLPFLDGDGEPTRFNGPYLMDKTVGNKILLVKNPYYWNKEKIFFEKIEIDSTSSPDLIYNRFQSKKTHWLGAPFNWPHRPLGKLSQKSNASNFFFFIYLNTEHPIFKSHLIRQAFSHAINRQEVIQNILCGKELSSSTEIAMFYKQLDLSYCISKAKKLFQQGIKHKNLVLSACSPVKLSCFSATKHERAAKYLQKKWQEVFGIKVDLDVQDWNVFYREVNQKPSEVFILFKDLFSKDVIPFLESFSHRNNNYGQWTNSNYTKVLALLKKANSKKEKWFYLNQIGKLFYKHMPVIPIFYTSCYSYTHDPYLRNTIISPDGEVDFRFASFQNKPILDLGLRENRSKYPLNQGDKNNKTPHLQQG